LILLICAGTIEEGALFVGLGFEGLFGVEGFEAILANIQDIFNLV
jgi:hypothetical protein